MIWNLKRLGFGNFPAKVRRRQDRRGALKIPQTNLFFFSDLCGLGVFAGDIPSSRGGLAFWLNWRGLSFSVLATSSRSLDHDRHDLSEMPIRHIGGVQTGRRRSGPLFPVRRDMVRRPGARRGVWLKMPVLVAELRRGSVERIHRYKKRPLPARLCRPPANLQRHRSQRDLGRLRRLPWHLARCRRIRQAIRGAPSIAEHACLRRRSHVRSRENIN